MAQKHLEVAGAEAFLNAGSGKGMAKHMRGNLLGDAGAVGDAADDLLDAAGGVAEGVVKGKIIRQDGKGAFGERHDAAFCFLCRTGRPCRRPGAGGPARGRSLLVRPASSETRRPVSSRVEITTFSIPERQALVRRSAFSLVRGSRFVLVLP